MVRKEIKKFIIAPILLIFSVLVMISFYINPEASIVGFVIKTFSDVQIQDPSLVLYLTFDDPNDPWKDYSSYNHVFTPNGNVAWADKDVCKWFGCADFTFTENGNDYLNSTAKWDNMAGIALNWWVYHTEKPKGSPSQFYFQIGDDKDGTLKTMQDSGFGPAPEFSAENGIVNALAGSDFTPEANTWYFYFIQYDPSQGMLYVWQNDKLVLNSSENFGNLNYNVDELIRVGIGKFNYSNWFRCRVLYKNYE